MAGVRLGAGGLDTAAIKQHGNRGLGSGESGAVFVSGGTVVVVTWSAVLVEWFGSGSGGVFWLERFGSGTGGVFLGGAVRVRLGWSGWRTLDPSVGVLQEKFFR
ncbi:unnamed protein product [Calypogeia fissa]